MYSAADLWDFGWGMKDLGGSSASALWRNAGSSIEGAARLLVNGAAADAAIQNACLTAELGLKGVVTRL